MDERMQIIVGQQTRTATGALTCTYSILASVWCQVSNMQSDTKESEIAERQTAVQGLKFRIRRRNGLSEKMIIGYGYGAYAKQYDIESITEHRGEYRKMYLDVVAVHRDTPVLIDGETQTVPIVRMTQRDANFSGEKWLITAGALPGIESPEQADTNVWLYRSGVRQMYDVGYRIDNQTNEIIWLQTQLRNEPVLLLVG